MAGSNGEVVIIVAGDDQSGAVLQAVETNLARVQARAQAAGNSLAMAGEHAVPAMAAASASVRVLDGDFTHLMRAEERFLSSLPGIQTLMQAAFPVIGLVAVAEGLYRGEEAARKFIETTRQMGETITTGFAEANLSVEKNNDSLRVSNDRLAMEIAKLEKKPANGLKLALDEARLSADDLAESLIKDNDRIAELMKKNSVSWLAGAFTGQASTEAPESDAKDYQKKSDDLAYEGARRQKEAKTAEESRAARVETQNQLYKLQSETLSKISSKIKNLTEDSKDIDIYGNHTSKTNKYNQAQTDDYKGLYTSIANQQDSVGVRSTQQQEQTEKGIADAKHQQGEIDKENARAAEQERKKEEAWLEKVQKMGVGSSQTAGYAQQKVAAELLEKSHEESIRMADQEAEAWVKSQETQAQAAVKASEREIQAAREAQESRMKAASEQYQGVEQDTAFGVKTGSMSESDRMQALRQAAQEEYNIKLNAMQQELSLDALDPNNPEKVQRDLDQIVAMKTAYSRQMITLDQQEAEQRRAAQTKVLSDVLDPLMEGTKTLTQRFKDMADSIVKDLERIAEQKAIEGILGGLNGGGGGQGAGAGGAQRSGGLGGVGGLLGGLLGGIFGGKSKASNGGLATGAGTAADSITSGLQQGKTDGSGGVAVTIINQGTAQTVASSGSTGGGMEQQVITLVLKDADTLGPMTQALRGAIGMLG